jgi:hypothetical protein
MMAIAVDKRRHAAVGIDGEEIRLLVLGAAEVEPNQLHRRSQMLGDRAGFARIRRFEIVKLHPRVSSVTVVRPFLAALKYVQEHI